MKKIDPDAILLLIAELEKDIKNLDRLVEENEQAMARIEAGARENLDYAALGYTLHNLYCLMENYFLRIAKSFENQIERSFWHKDLLERMTVPIEGLRPALLDDKAALLIDELRAFRHVFRNMYQREIDPRKVLVVQEIVPLALGAFRACHTSFIEKMRKIMEE